MNNRKGYLVASLMTLLVALGMVACDVTLPFPSSSSSQIPLDVRLEVEKNLCLGGDLPFTVTFSSRLDALTAVPSMTNTGIASYTLAPDLEWSNLPANEAVTFQGTFRLEGPGGGALRPLVIQTILRVTDGESHQGDIGSGDPIYFLVTDRDIFMGRHRQETIKSDHVLKLRAKSCDDS